MTVADLRRKARIALVMSQPTASCRGYASTTSLPRPHASTTRIMIESIHAPKDTTTASPRWLGVTKAKREGHDGARTRNLLIVAEQAVEVRRVNHFATRPDWMEIRDRRVLIS